MFLGLLALALALSWALSTALATWTLTLLFLELWRIGEDVDYLNDGSKHVLWSFGATFVFKSLLYSVVILVKNIGVLMLFLEFWRMTLTFMMVPNMFLGNLEQLLFSKHCSKKLYLEIAVKFSSQEHGRPPRIQEEKSGLDTKKSKSRLDFNRK